MNHQPYAFILLSCIASVLLIRFVALKAYRRQAFTLSVDERRQRRVVHLINFGMLVPTILWTVTPMLDPLQLDLVEPVRWLGFAIYLAGIAFLFWTHVTLGSYFSPRTQLRSQHVLITSGPYRFIRHPMYLSVFTCVLAGGLLTANAGFLLMQATAAISLVFLRLPVEERMLSERFGAAYGAYRKRTWKIVPGVF